MRQERKGCQTKRAPEAGDSAEIPGSFWLLSLSRHYALSFSQACPAGRKASHKNITGKKISDTILLEKDTQRMTDSK